MEMDLTLENAALISPWRLKAPLSPDMAARREHKVLALDDIVRYCARKSLREYEYLLVEGVGGVMSPVNEYSTVVDWIAGTQFSTIVVAGSYVGAISHTLTALEALHARKIRVFAVIVSPSESSVVSAEETMESLRPRIDNETALVCIPRILDAAQAWKSVPDLLSSLKV